MNRTGLTISAILATIGVSKVLFPATVASMFALDGAVALFAVFVAIVAYGVWFGPLRFLAGSHGLQAAGITILVAAAASIFSPTLLGARTYYLPIADIFLLIESSIVMLMIGLEKKPAGALSPLVYASVTWQLFQRRLHRGQVSVPASN